MGAPSSKPPAARRAWNLDELVGALRTARAEWDHHTGHTSSEGFPSRDALVGIVRGLRAALFPKHYGSPDLPEESVDYFVGNTLDTTLSELLEQVRRELAYRARAEGVPARDLERRASNLVRDFTLRLPDVRRLLETDVRAAYDGDPAARGVDEVLFCYPGVTAVTHYRLAHVLYELGVPLLARIIAELAHASTGIDIHPGAQIGESFFIDHGTGVVIGETAILGARVRLYQGVTLGAKSFPLDEHGVTIKGAPRHPIIEDDVVIYAGATVLGRVTIGRGSSIGGNVWLTNGVPANSRITQARSRADVFVDGGGI